MAVQTIKAVYVQEADYGGVDYTPTSAVNAGDVIAFGNWWGVALHPIAANVQGSLRIEGVFDFLKFTGEVTTFGERMYWDVSAQQATGVIGYSSGILGVCIKAALAGDLTVRVKLTPNVT